MVMREVHHRGGFEMKKETKKERKEMIKYRLEQIRGFMKYHRLEIDKMKRELDFMNGHYDKSWEEEYQK